MCMQSQVRRMQSQVRPVQSRLRTNWGSDPPLANLALRV